MDALADKGMCKYEFEENAMKNVLIMEGNILCS